jgi:K+-sensing histidine kinase KdpD
MMKKTSIQSKILLMSVVLVLITISGISLTYYLLIRQDKRREFQQRIQIAFDIVWDDYEARSTAMTNTVQEFAAEDTLAMTTARYIEEEERLQSISFITNNLVEAAEELKRFGRINSVQRIMLYGANRRLLTAYRRQDDQESTGIYIKKSEGDDVYLPINALGQITSMLSGRTEIPEDPLLENMTLTYTDDFPETVKTSLSTQDANIGIRVVAPISFQEQVTGLLMVEVSYTQAIIERYARLSQTAVNLFAGTGFCAGTFR